MYEFRLTSVDVHVVSKVDGNDLLRGDHINRSRSCSENLKGCTLCSVHFACNKNINITSEYVLSSKGIQ